MSEKAGRPRIGRAPAESAIEDYGVIGDMRTAALVDRWGRLDWLCWPSFDSPPLFRRLLDPTTGSSWQMAPTDAFASERRYLPDTNVLETTFTCASGTVVATDLLSPPVDDAAGSQVVRMLEGRSGAVPVRMSLRATADWGPASAGLSVRHGALVITGPHGPVAALTTNGQVTVAGEEARLETVLELGQQLVMVLSREPRDSRTVLDRAVADRRATVQWWRDWLGRCTLPAVRPDVVSRSALTLKLLHSGPTSGLVAAPTTSLPEVLGGARNWDYRYSWLRDSSLMVLALQRLGQHHEAMGLWSWIAAVAGRSDDGDLSVAYTLAGHVLPDERELPHLAGHRGSRPVRIGNAAGTQRQHDVYGHVLAAAAHCYRHMDGMPMAAPHDVLCRIADLAAQRWDRPDDSIWEVRGGRSHHTYSRLMCWLALDQAVDLAGRGALQADSAAWATQRDAIHHEVLYRAWNADLGALTATVGGDDVDAAVLVAPLIGFLPADDARCRSTRSVVTERLSDNGLLRRYRYDDGVSDDEGAFLLCSLWLADNHTLDGDPERGHELLERVLRTGNDLGLLAEQADPSTDTPLGNFPQGLTHLGVVQTVHRLAAAR